MIWKWLLCVFISYSTGNGSFRKTAFLLLIPCCAFISLVTNHSHSVFSWDKKLRALSSWWKKGFSVAWKKRSSGFQQTCDSSLWDFFIHLSKAFQQAELSVIVHTSCSYAEWQEGSFARSIHQMPADFLLTVTSKYLIKIPPSSGHFHLFTCVLWISLCMIC